MNTNSIIVDIISTTLITSTSMMVLFVTVVNGIFTAIWGNAIKVFIVIVSFFTFSTFTGLERSNGS